MNTFKLIRTFRIAAVLAVVLSGVTPVLAQSTLVLSFLHVNDWNLMSGVRGSGGAARIAKVVAEERARVESLGGHAIVTFGGDMISPSVLSGIDKGAHMIDLANDVGFDVAVVGNHEFDFGPKVLMERLAESSAIWLAGNVTHKGQPGFPGAQLTTIVEKKGYRIGFLGLVTTDTAMNSSPGADVGFEPTTETGRRLARTLVANGADIIVALTHQSLDEDIELLRKVEAIDIVLGGHDHLLVARYNERSAVMKAGSQGRHVGILNLTVERKKRSDGTSRLVWTPEFNLRSTAGIEPDQALAAKVSAYDASLDEKLNVVIGSTLTEIDTRGSVVRSKETAFGNLLTDAMREATGSEIALVNGGGIRGDTVYLPGTRITRKMVLTELPFGDKTVVIRLNGRQVRQALENSVSVAERPSGRFPQVSGVSFSFDTRRPAGDRITDISVNGSPLNPDKTYTFATNDFLAESGDDYSVFKAGEVLIDAQSGDLTAGQLIDHIASMGTVSPKIEGRITREN